MTTSEYIQWAQENCPEPVSATKSSFEVAWAEYEAVEDRLGGIAEDGDAMSRMLWMEITIRVHRLGWAVSELENRRWPITGTAKVKNILSVL